MPDQKPTVGRIVHYRLSEQDANAINRRRDDACTSGVARDGSGVVVHSGNTTCAGDVYPAVVVRVFDPSVTTANLQVLLDGNDTYWATSRVEGDQPGNWSWPTRA